MSNDDLAALLTTASFIIYVSLLVLASARQIARLMAYWKGWVVRHDFTFKGPRSGVWRRDLLDGRRHNHFLPLWIEHIPPSPIPDLLKRDIWFTLGLAWPFLLVLGARTLVNLGIIASGFFAMNLLWIVITSGPALAAVIAYTYYEWFKIERIDVEETKRKDRARWLLLWRKRFDRDDANRRQPDPDFPEIPPGEEPRPTS